MGLELPAFLCPLLAEVGATWPDSDEAKIFEIAEAFRKCGESFGSHQADVKRTVDAVFDENRGPGLDQTKLFYLRLVAGPASHHDVIKLACGVLSGTYYTISALVLAAKVRIIALLTEYAAQKFAILAAQASWPNVAAGLEALAALAKATAQVIEQVIEVTMGVLRPLLDGATKVIDTYTDVATPLLRSRQMDKERDAGGGRPQLPAGIDPDDTYRQQVASDPNSRYFGHPEWVPGNPPGRSSQPSVGLEEGGGVWKQHSVTPGSPGQEYQEYVTGVKHPGTKGAPELFVPKGDGSGNEIPFDGYVPAGSRGPGSPPVYIDAKDGFSYTNDPKSFIGKMELERKLAEARGQVDALASNPGAKGAVIEWHVSDPEGAEAFRRMVAADDKLRNKVFVYYTPRK